MFEIETGRWEESPIVIAREQCNSSSNEGKYRQQRGESELYKKGAMLSASPLPGIPTWLSTHCTMTSFWGGLAKSEAISEKR